jgi:uncharacterized protein
MIRNDFAFPFAIGPGAGQAAQAAYAEHVSQMVRQVLLTDPGERVCLPEFGAGLRRLVFAPLSIGLEAAVQMAVMQALKRWLAEHLIVRKVSVRSAADVAGGAGLPEGAVVVEVEYELIETRSAARTEVMVA